MHFVLCSSSIGLLGEAGRVQLRRTGPSEASLGGLYQLHRFDGRHVLPMRLAFKDKPFWPTRPFDTHVITEEGCSPSYGICELGVDRLKADRTVSSKPILAVRVDRPRPSLASTGSNEQVMGLLQADCVAPLRP